MRTAASTQKITAAIWLHISPMPAIQVQWHDRTLAVFSKIIQSLWNGSLTDWDFLHSPFKMQKLLPVRLWYSSGCNQPDLKKLYALEFLLLFKSLLPSSENKH